MEGGCQEREVVLLCQVVPFVDRCEVVVAAAEGAHFGGGVVDLSSVL